MSKKKLKLKNDSLVDTTIEENTKTNIFTENPLIQKDEFTQNKSSLDNSEDIIEISQLRGKEIWHYSMLDKFFSGCELGIVQKMVDIINGEHLISLRFLDWFVTRYSYLYKTTINITNQFYTQNNFNVNISYKAQLKSFTKKYFDPFKRKKKFVYCQEKYNISFLTTLGQLNFFRWAITNDIIKYTETNYKLIISKYDYVNSFFKKHSCNSSSNMSLSNMSLSNNSIKTDDMISEIYNNTKNTKKTYIMPKVSRNVCIEL
jgi:hypothetical protein